MQYKCGGYKINSQKDRHFAGKGCTLHCSIGCAQLKSSSFLEHFPVDMFMQLCLASKGPCMYSRQQTTSATLLKNICSALYPKSTSQGLPGLHKSHWQAWGYFPTTTMPQKQKSKYSFLSWDGVNWNLIRSLPGYTKQRCPDSGDYRFIGHSLNEKSNKS